MPKFPGVLLNNNPNAPSLDLNDLQVKGVGIFANKAARDLLDSNIQTEGYLAIMKDDDNIVVYKGGGWTDAANWERISGTIGITEDDGNPVGDVSNLSFPVGSVSVTGNLGSVNFLANQTETVTTNFSGVLSTSDTTVQAALETIDSLSLTATGITTDTANFNGVLSTSDTTVQAALDTIDNLSLTATGISTVTTNFNGVLSASDTTVQAALDTIDNLSLTATGITTSTTNFNGVLSASDTTVQAALDTIDNLSLTAGGITTDTTNFNGVLSASDTTVQAALDTLDGLSLTLEGLSDTPTGYGTSGQVLITNGVDGFTFTGYSFPTATGTQDQVLKVDANGDLVFGTDGGAPYYEGANTNAYLLADDTYLNWEGTSNYVSGGALGVLFDSTISEVSAHPSYRAKGLYIGRGWNITESNSKIHDLNSSVVIGNRITHDPSPSANVRWIPAIHIGNDVDYTGSTSNDGAIMIGGTPIAGGIGSGVMIGGTKVPYNGVGIKSSTGVITTQPAVAILGRTKSYSVNIGFQAQSNGGSNNSTTVVGHTALRNETGQNSVAFGGSAGEYIIGGGNTCIGASALRGVNGGSTGSQNNTGVGREVLKGINGGDNNVAIGYRAGHLLTTGNRNVFIGTTAGGQVTTESDKLYIDNSSTTTPLIYGEFNNDLLRVNGTFQINDPSSTGYAFPTAVGTEDQVLKVDANGDLVFDDAGGSLWQTHQPNTDINISYGGTVGIKDSSVTYPTGGNLHSKVRHFPADKSANVPGQAVGDTLLHVHEGKILVTTESTNESFTAFDVRSAKHSAAYSLQFGVESSQAWIDGQANLKFKSGGVDVLQFGYSSNHSSIDIFKIGNNLPVQGASNRNNGIWVGNSIFMTRGEFLFYGHTANVFSAIKPRGFYATNSGVSIASPRSGYFAHFAASDGNTVGSYGYLGINANNPLPSGPALEVSDSYGKFNDGLKVSGDFETGTDGVVITSPDGTRYRLTVTNAGALSIGAA